MKLYDFDVDCVVTEGGERREETVRIQAISESVAKASAVLKIETEGWKTKTKAIAKAVRKIGFVKEFV